MDAQFSKGRKGLIKISLLMCKINGHRTVPEKKKKKKALLYSPFLLQVSKIFHLGESPLYRYGEAKGTRPIQPE